MNKFDHVVYAWSLRSSSNIRHNPNPVAPSQVSQFGPSSVAATNVKHGFGPARNLPNQYNSHTEQLVYKFDRPFGASGYAYGHGGHKSSPLSGYQSQPQAQTQLCCTIGVPSNHLQNQQHWRFWHNRAGSHQSPQLVSEQNSFQQQHVQTKLTPAREFQQFHRPNQRPGAGFNAGPFLGSFVPPLVTTAKECFLKFPNSLIVNVPPIERRIPLTEEQCLKRCLTSERDIHILCKAAVYVPKYKSCDLFHQDAHQKPARMIKLFAYHYYTPTERCKDLPFVKPPPPAPTPTPSPPPNPFVTTRPAGQGPLPALARPKRPLVTTLQETVTATAPPVPAAGFTEEDGCPRGTRAVFQMAEGWELIGSDGYATNDVSEADCIEACRINQTPFGSPYNCLSIDYVLDSRTCILTSEAASPARAGVLNENTNKVYYEKTCLPENIGSQCGNNQIIRQPQRVMVGFGETAESVQTQEECIQRCFNAANQLGFPCLAALYYYEEAESNCLLNSESRESQPAFFAVEEDYRVEYFGIDACISDDFRVLQTKSASHIEKDTHSSRATIRRLIPSPATARSRNILTPRIKIVKNSKTTRHGSSKLFKGSRKSGPEKENNAVDSGFGFGTLKTLRLTRKNPLKKATTRSLFERTFGSHSAALKKVDTVTQQLIAHINSVNRRLITARKYTGRINGAKGLKNNRTFRKGRRKQKKLLPGLFHVEVDEVSDTESDRRTYQRDHP